MHIVIISGSHRSEQTYKISQYIEKRLQEKNCTTDIIALSKHDIPLRTQEWRDKESDVSKNILQPLRDRLVKADGFVIASPERSGMAAPGLKNLFLIASSRNEFAHKPALLVGVSSGMGGSYPIAELRMSSYKNTKINYLPDHVIIRNCEHVLNNDELNAGSEDDIHIKKRIERSLDMLGLYTASFNNIRSNLEVDIYKHAYGM